MMTDRETLTEICTQMKNLISEKCTSQSDVEFAFNSILYLTYSKDEDGTEFDKLKAFYNNARQFFTVARVLKDIKK